MLNMRLGSLYGSQGVLGMSLSAGLLLLLLGSRQVGSMPSPQSLGQAGMFNTHLGSLHGSSCIQGMVLGPGLGLGLLPSSCQSSLMLFLRSLSPFTMLPVGLLFLLEVRLDVSRMSAGFLAHDAIDNGCNQGCVLHPQTVRGLDLIVCTSASKRQFFLFPPTFAFIFRLLIAEDLVHMITLLLQDALLHALLEVAHDVVSSQQKNNWNAYVSRALQSRRYWSRMGNSGEGDCGCWTTYVWAQAPSASCTGSRV